MKNNRDDDEVFDGKKTIRLSQETLRGMQEESYKELKDKIQKLDQAAANSWQGARNKIVY